MQARTALLLIALTACSSGDGGSRGDEGAGYGNEQLPAERDVIVHLFEWPWDSVAAECTEVLGPRGFGGVQVSPPQEHVVLPERGFPWWQDYQPVSYQLVSRRGDRAAFAAMVETCHAAGVKIYADAVINHMAGSASSVGPGSGGSTFSHYDYPAVPYTAADFHHCGRNGNDDIANYDDHSEVRNCELVDLADLATESDEVRERLIEYMSELRSLGVDGFRIDAGKHMAVADLEAIVAALDGSPIIYVEIIEGGPREVSPLEYLGAGDVTEFRYGDVVGGAFRDGDLSGLAGLAAQMALDGDDAIAFIDNHDTQRNGRARLTYKDGAPYALAEAFMLAFPHGTPQVMSSFSFDDHDQGPPADESGITLPVECGEGWECEHRARTTAGMVDFHNQVSGTELTHWWSGGSSQIAFGRGADGFVVFNRGDRELSRKLQTGLPAGTYCDVSAGDLDGESCSGPTYTVDANGFLTARVASDSMLAIHTGAVVAAAR